MSESTGGPASALRTFRAVAHDPVDKASRAVAGAYVSSESARAISAPFVDGGSAHRFAGQQLSSGHGATRHSPFGSSFSSAHSASSGRVHAGSIAAGRAQAQRPQAAALAAATSSTGSAMGGWSNGLVDSSAKRLSAARSYSLRPTERSSLHWTHGSAPGMSGCRQLATSACAHGHATLPIGVETFVAAPNGHSQIPPPGWAGDQSAPDTAADVRQLRAEMAQLRAEVGRAAGTRPRESVYDIEVTTMSGSEGLRPGTMQGVRYDGARHATAAVGRPSTAASASRTRVGPGRMTQASGDPSHQGLQAKHRHTGVPIGATTGNGGRRVVYRSAVEREGDIETVMMLPSEDDRY